jgi:hypothetical protein
LEELEALCEEWEYYTNQESEFDYVWQSDERSGSN